MNPLYVFFGIIVAVLIALAASVDPIIREALSVITGIVLTLGLVWCGIDFVSFCDGAKSHLFEAFHDEVGV